MGREVNGQQAQLLRINLELWILNLALENQTTCYPDSNSWMKIQSENDLFCFAIIERTLFAGTDIRNSAT